MIRVLYFIAASGWILHLLYWIARFLKHKKGLLSAEDFASGLFQDYTLATGALILICLIGMYGIYLGNI